MNESDFNRQVEAILLSIEQGLEENGVDLDYETTGGVLNISFRDGSMVVVNRQVPLRQIWVATRVGGFHFNYDPEAGHWYCSSNGEEFFAALGRWCSGQAGEPIVFVEDK